MRGYFRRAGSAVTATATGPDIVVNGFVGWSVGENLMGGSVRVTRQRLAERRLERPGRNDRDRGRRFVAAPAYPSKGATLAIGGNAGAMSGFMAQAGVILIGGNAGHGPGWTPCTRP